MHKRHIGLAFLVLLATIGSACTAAEEGGPLPTLTPRPTARPGGLYVDGAETLGLISPFVYGANFGPWSVVPYDLLEEAETSGIQFLRFPGGEWGDRNALKDYHIDRFMELIDRMEAEPHICVRLLDGTPEAAAELVRYANVEQSYDVTYWCIGNEPNLFPEGYDIEQYNQDWRAIAEAMVEVDPDIQFVGPNISQFTGSAEVDPQDEAGRDWLREFLEANGDLVDMVAVHRYPFPHGTTAPPATVEELRADAETWDQLVRNLRSVVREVTGRDLPVAIGEVNSHWSHAIRGEATPDSFYNAIWWGDVLGRLIRQRVQMVSYFALQTPPTIGGFGLLATYEVRPTYYVYQIYQRFGEELLYASSDDESVSIYAAQRSDGAVTLIVVNLGDQEEEKTLMWDQIEPSGPAEVWRLDEDHLAEQLDDLSLSDGVQLSLPARSITLYVIPQ